MSPLILPNFTLHQKHCQNIADISASADLPAGRPVYQVAAGADRPVLVTLTEAPHLLWSQQPSNPIYQDQATIIVIRHKALPVPHVYICNFTDYWYRITKISSNVKIAEVCFIVPRDGFLPLCSQYFPIHGHLHRPVNIVDVEAK